VGTTNLQAQDTTTSARYVRSFTNPNRFYVVALNPRGFYECDCPAAQFNHRTPCKHVKAVAKTDAGLIARPKAQRSVVAEAEAIAEAAADEAREAVTAAEAQAYRDSLTMLLEV
jgi:hypothetical protein